MILGIAYMFFEASWLEVKNISFSNTNKGLKILQLSDIHIGKLRVKKEKIVKVLEQAKPDIVIITGDYIEKFKHIPSFLELLKSLTAISNIYLCLGNHDFKVFKKDKPGLDKYIENIEKCGSTVLHNKSVCIEKNGKKYNLIGIADKRSGYEDVLKALSSCSKNGALNIAFSHNPDIVFDIPKGRVDYLFCGHFHGGQIWAPFDLEFKLLRDEKLCKMGIKRGLHKLNGIVLYLNRGLGNVCFPLRFLSRPEITIYYLP
jgi:uncharacterized protein